MGSHVLKEVAKERTRLGGRERPDDGKQKNEGREQDRSESGMKEVQVHLVR